MWVQTGVLGRKRLGPWIQIKPNNRISLESGQTIQLQFQSKSKSKTEEPRIIERNKLGRQ